MFPWTAYKIDPNSLALLTWNRDSLSIYYVFGTGLGLGDVSFTYLFISILN